MKAITQAQGWVAVIRNHQGKLMACHVAAWAILDDGSSVGLLPMDTLDGMRSQKLKAPSNRVQCKYCLFSELTMAEREALEAGKYVDDKQATGQTE